MKIVSWNVNGLRAVHKRGDFMKFIKKTKPDIFCLQEIKAEDHQLPDEIRALSGYHAYFSSSQGKKGYSGVALYTKTEPDEVIKGIGIPRFDQEGRIVGAVFGNVVVLNIYFPNGGGGPERLAYKLDFYDAFLEYIEDLRSKNKKIIFCGDVNTAHEAIDLARPKENEENTGFLPEERAWIDEVVSRGYIDIFRKLYPSKEGAYTYWDIKTAARERNVGWRIDYFFIDPRVAPAVQKTGILSDIYGSDHCPIELVLDEQKLHM